MKRLTDAFLMAVLIVCVTFTGAFAQGTGDGPDKPGMRGKKTVQGPKIPEQGPGMPPDFARDQAARREKEKAIREFQNSIRGAERKFNADQKAAAKLKGEERKAAMEKAVEEMKATIKTAEKKKDASLEKFGGHRRKKPPQHKESARKNLDAGQMGIEQKNAEQAEGQGKDDTASPPDRQKH